MLLLPLMVDHADSWPFGLYLSGARLGRRRHAATDSRGSLLKKEPFFAGRHPGRVGDLGGAYPLGPGQRAAYPAGARRPQDIASGFNTEPAIMR